MPKAPTRKVLRRREEILRLLRLNKRLTTTQIADTLDCSQSMAYYVLKLLKSEGRVECWRSGKSLVWRLRG